MTMLFHGVMPVILYFIVFYAANLARAIFGAMGMDISTIPHSRWDELRVAPKQNVLPGSAATTRPQNSIEITEPINNSSVGFKHLVNGFVEPPGAWVQVLVLANDGLWHLQSYEATVNGHAWHSTCQFGNTEQSGLGRTYKIVAVTGGDKLAKNTCIGAIPENLIQSNIVSVQRNGPPKRNTALREDIEIISAEWGVGETRYKDKTRLLREYLASGTENLRASNEFFTDEFIGLQKHLIVKYRSRGEPEIKTRVFIENELIQFHQ